MCKTGFRYEKAKIHKGKLVWIPIFGPSTLLFFSLYISLSLLLSLYLSIYLSISLPLSLCTPYEYERVYIFTILLIHITIFFALHFNLHYSHLHSWKYDIRCCAETRVHYIYILLNCFTFTENGRKECNVISYIIL